MPEILNRIPNFAYYYVKTSICALLLILSHNFITGILRQELSYETEKIKQMILLQQFNWP